MVEDIEELGVEAQPHAFRYAKGFVAANSRFGYSLDQPEPMSSTVIWQPGSLVVALLLGRSQNSL